ncbi:hypothetical protein WG66_009474 [Moniliophthora roreri]|nr:hypothetical protein WG66_009474 [Moniliophthora roreri]
MLGADLCADPNSSTSIVEVGCPFTPVPASGTDRPNSTSPLPSQARRSLLSGIFSIEAAVQPHRFLVVITVTPSLPTWSISSVAKSNSQSPGSTPFSLAPAPALLHPPTRAFS